MAAFTASVASAAELDAALSAWAGHSKLYGAEIEVTAPINVGAKRTLTASHSPTLWAKLRLRCAPGAFIGSWERIMGWTAVDGSPGLFRANIGAGLNFMRLWADDELRPIQRARWRNYAQVVPDQVRYTVWADPYMYLPGAAFEGVTEPEKCVIQQTVAWTVRRHNIAEVAAGEGDYEGKWRVTMAEETAATEWLAHAQGFPLHGTMQACRVMNAPEHIAEAGDWTYDRETGVLTIKAWDDIQNAGDLEAVGLCRPGAAETILEIAGCNDVVLDEFTIKRCGWALPSRDGMVFWNAFGGYFTSPTGTSLSFNRAPAALSILRGNRITLSQAEIAFCEGGAINIGSQFAGGAKDVVVHRCAIHHAGYGVLADHLASVVDTATDAQIPERIHLHDTLIWEVGDDIGGGGMWLAAVRDARVTNCHVVRAANSAYQAANGGRFTPYWSSGMGVTLVDCIADDPLLLCADHGAFYLAGNVTVDNFMALLPEGARVRRGIIAGCASYGAMNRGWEGVLGHYPAIYYDEGSTCARTAGFIAHKDSRLTPGLAAALRAEYDAAGYSSPTGPFGSGTVINENGAKFCEYKRIVTVGYDEEDGDHIHSVSYASQGDRDSYTTGSGTSADPARWRHRSWGGPTLGKPSGTWFTGGGLTADTEAVISLTADGTTATVTFAAALAGRVNGLAVVIDGANESEWNAVWRDLVFASSTEATFPVPEGMTSPATGTITIAPYLEPYPDNWPFEAIEDVFSDGVVPPDGSWPIDTLVSFSVLTDVGPEIEVEARRMGLTKAARDRWPELIEASGLSALY